MVFSFTPNFILIGASRHCSRGAKNPKFDWPYF